MATPSTRRSFLRSTKRDRRDIKQSLKGSRKSQSGIGKLTLLVFGTLTAIIVYCGYHILPFFYYYYELQNHFESHARVASVYTDKQIREKLNYLIKRMQIPAEPQDLKITRVDGSISISLSYDEVFYVTWDGKDYDLHTFHFEAKAKEQIAPKK